MNKPTKGLAVDGGCKGNPGPVEWRGVIIETGKELFRAGPYPGGTNNVAEFLAIIHALSIYDGPIYSDSQTALSWARHKYGKPDSITDPGLRKIMNRANLKITTFNNLINRLFKWETQYWGENPADFGRK